jgi:hypothetical protein
VHVRILFALLPRTHALSAIIELADSAKAAVCALDGGALLAGRWPLRWLLRDVAARHVRDVCRHQLVEAAAEREARHLAGASVAAGLSHDYVLKMIKGQSVATQELEAKAHGRSDREEHGTYNGQPS